MDYDRVRQMANLLDALGLADIDPAAQHELVRLRLAYLNWAYAGQRAALS